TYRARRDPVIIAIDRIAKLAHAVFGPAFVCALAITKTFRPEQQRLQTECDAMPFDVFRPVNA
ncbi:MAG: hypothetical protein M0P19_03900, partial [Nevskia sp.]|nr:hypothetical protein [Nevskia sp.]